MNNEEYKPVGKNVNFENSIVFHLEKGIMMKGASELTKKKLYPIIDVKASGHPDWYRGAFVLAFVYSKHHGNFILRGYRGEVKKYLEKKYTHYFVYWSMWCNGTSRGHWEFWKDRVSFYEPSKLRKTWKYNIVKYDDVSFGGFIKTMKVLDFPFKRIPKRWIPLFDQF